MDVGGVDQCHLSDLVHDGFNDFGVRVPKVRNRELGYHVDVLLAVHILDSVALCTLPDDLFDKLD